MDNIAGVIQNRFRKRIHIMQIITILRNLRIKYGEDYIIGTTGKNTGNK